MISQTNTIKPVNTLTEQQMPYMLSLGDKRSETRAQEVAQEFEALFIEQILKQADQTMDHEDNILYAGQAEDIVRGMYNQQLARGMTQAGGFGIAALIENELAADNNAADKE
jgi:peptidoglycan hydrolase FlgJ